MIARRDARAAGLLASAVALALAPSLFLGRSYFWSDLSYLNFPWRALVSEMLQAGRAPLWNPYNYLGMPLLGNFQSGVLYPGNLLFYLFPFAGALKLYLALHLLLAGVLAFLWLRGLAFKRFASLLAATAWALGGFTMGHLPFLNHLGCLCWFPALFLFALRPLPLAAALGLCLADGYPVFALGQVLAAFLLAPWLAPEARRSGGLIWPLRSFAIGGLAGAGLAAAVLLPSLELTLGSVRALGLARDVTLAYSLRPADLIQLLGPFVLGAGFSPALYWWKTIYWGLAPLAAAALGVWALARGSRRLGLALAFYALGVLLLVSGGSNPISTWLWGHLPPLKFVRYPANALFLLLPALACLTASGGQRLRWAGLWWLFAAGELIVAAWVGQPFVSDAYYRDAGPLVARLQGEPAGSRYLLSPLALDWHRGEGATFPRAVSDFKRRLYGLSNAPFHLSAVGNFGEPLVPGPNYGWMDFLYSRPGLDAVAPYLPLVGVSIVLTRDRRSAEALSYAGRTLWHVYRYPGPVSRAYFSPRRLPETLSGPPSVLEPLSYAEPREDRFEISGDAGPGWVYASNPLYPGWKGWSNGRLLEMRPAYGAFLQFRHAGGPFRAYFRYDPSSWTWGLILTVAFLGGLGFYCYNAAELPQVPSPPRWGRAGWG